MRILLTILVAGTAVGLPAAAARGAEVPPRGVERQPLIRELQTGYLLHCTFRAIRPYIWKQRPLLSGWETDDSGGTWEGRPSGFFPHDFAFHVESFQLQDTSAQSAVTIRHQIARQTEGQITLAFRFMLPAPLEGATWQLRDLDGPALSIVTHEGKLCCETAAQPLALVPLEWNREYGVLVIADLTTRAADVFVDGQLRARAVPFLRPVRSLDYVLVKTGDAAVGSLFLPLVSVWKGYLVNETFADCGVGRAPGDWETTSFGGTGTVERFPCSAQPDVFSLKLENAVQCDKHFAPCSATTVWEYRCLLPQKSDGAASELLSGREAVGKIVTKSGDLCYVDPHGKHLPLVKGYRANLWYALKLVADPRSGRAEITVNGKRLEPAAEFTLPDKPFDGIQFRPPADGVMWVDDVRVYPWRDYPADYVPQPHPMTGKSGSLVGVHSCSLWKEGDAYAGWEYVYPFAKRRKPYLGWYDEGRPEVADWEIKWQVEHGIDFELYCWYRPNDAKGQPIKDGILEQGIRDGLFNARYSALKKFAIMYTNQGAGDTDPDDWREHIVPYWIEYFFKDPRYLKIDGQPVLSIYYPANFQRDFGGVAGCRQALDVLRAQCRQAGFPGVIVLMELRNADTGAMRQMKAMGVDYCYAYTWGTGDVNRQRRSNEAQREAAAVAGFAMLPSVSVGWQTAPWDGRPESTSGWAAVPDYQGLLQWAKDDFMPSLPENSLGRRMIILPNWNEFGEGHFLMPSNLAGFGYLDAIRNVFAAGAAHEDAVPTEAQKRRFTVWYPRE